MSHRHSMQPKKYLDTKSQRKWQEAIKKSSMTRKNNRQGGRHLRDNYRFIKRSEYLKVLIKVLESITPKIIC